MATTTTTFDGEKAIAWMNAVNELKEQTDTVLKQASNTISEVSTTSAGSIAETFVNLGEQTITAFNNLISSVGECVQALSNAIDKFTELEETVISGIKAAAKSFFGIGI